MCLCCHSRPPSPGHTWCSSCYQSIGRTSSIYQLGQKCVNCKINHANLGYQLCQNCFDMLRGYHAQQQYYMMLQLCPNCYTHMSSPGYEMCQYCAIQRHLCCICQKQTIRDGQLMCAICQSRQNQYTP